MTRHADEVVAEFDRQAARWAERYRPGGSMRSRVDGFRAAVRRLAPEGRVLLDFGCGSGEIAAGLVGDGFTPVLADVSEEMLTRASRLPELANARTVRAVDGKPLPLEDASVDVVVSSSVVEYVVDPLAYAAELRRVAKRGAVFVITVPDSDSTSRRIEAVVAAAIPARLPLGVLPRRLRGYAEYLRLSKNRFERSEWSRIFKPSNIRAENGFLWLEGRVE